MKPQRTQPQSATISQQKLYSGPVPDPETLEKYNQIDPSFAQRLILMAEKEQTDRHANNKILLINEKESMQSHHSTIRRGQVISGVVTALFVGMCCYALYLGIGDVVKWVVGALAGICAVFVGIKIYKN